MALVMDSSPILSDVRIVVFDTETTGLSPVDDDVIEIAALSLEGGVETGRFETLVDPGRRIPPALTAIHGIDDAMVRGKPRLAEAGARFLEFAGDSILAAHNAAYDMAMLIGPLLKAGHEPAGNAVIDTCRLARRLIDAPNYQLGTLAGILGVDISRAHRAMPDVEATARLLLECLARMGQGATLADAERIGAMRLIFGIAPVLASGPRSHGSNARITGVPLDAPREDAAGLAPSPGMGTPASPSTAASPSTPPEAGPAMWGTTRWLHLRRAFQLLLGRHVRARRDPSRAIARALGGRETVEIVYRGGSHGDRPRRITPLFFLELDGQLNVAALCHYDRVLKNFRVAQIESVRPA